MSQRCKPESAKPDVRLTCSTEYESIIDIVIDIGEITSGWEISFGIFDKKQREVIEGLRNGSDGGGIKLGSDGTQPKVRI